MKSSASSRPATVYASIPLLGIGLLWLGVIAPGKYADMLLVDGDPSRDIADIRKVATVVKGGKVYDPAALERALGILPRPASP